MACWTGAGMIMPACLRTSRSAATSARSPATKRRAVAGEVGLLGQRVDGEQALVRAAADVGVQDARGRRADLALAPVELGVALVARDDDPVLAGPGDDLGAGAATPRTWPLGLPGLLSHSSLASSRRSAGRGSSSDWATTAGGTGDARPDVVGRVGDRRDADDVAGAEAEQGRQPGHELLAADRRQHARRGRGPARRDAGRTTRRSAARSVGRARRSAGSPARRPPRRGLARTTSGVGSTGVPTDRSTMPVRVRDRSRLVGRERVPGEVRKVRATRRCHSGAHSSCSCGGRASMSGWSLSIMPSLAAPPGLPRSLKNSTLAL